MSSAFAELGSDCPVMHKFFTLTWVALSVDHPQFLVYLGLEITLIGFPEIVWL